MPLLEKRHVDIINFLSKISNWLKENLKIAIDIITIEMKMVMIVVLVVITRVVMLIIIK